jgi:hypothetical protein
MITPLGCLRIVMGTHGDLRERLMHAYNLFRCKSEAGVFCAVPEDRVIPDFVTAERWEFTGKADQDRAAPLGFDGAAAALGVRFNGFYLFEAF